MPYKLIASDFDDTLVPRTRVVGERAVRAIGAAVDQGALFVLSTGRDMHVARPVLEQLGLYGRDDQYAVLVNGCIVTTLAGNAIARHHMDKADAELCYAIARERGYFVQVNAMDATYVANVPESLTSLGSTTDAIEMDEHDLSFLGDTPVLKVLYLHEGEDYLRSIAAGLPQLTSRLDVTYSSDYCLEWLPRGVTKATGLRELCERLGLGMSDVLAIGDSSNDAEMLEAAGLGVGVANITKAARPFCDYVCEAECDKGVAEAIERFVLG